MKIGRNEPCHCGSRKKYKKCHLVQDEMKIDEKILEHFEKQKVRENALRQKGIYVNYVNPVPFKGKKAWALGNKVYLRDNLNETFHDFIQFILKETLGFEWVSMQCELPEDQQHYLVRCFSKFDEWRRDVTAQKNLVRKNVFGAKPSGYVKSMLTVAFDVATLRHNSNLPNSLISRLKIPDQYQGARYEITVAAIIARLGFSIEWLDETKQGEKHCEFIATHIETKTKIAIEVKSRHRSGVLHVPGVVNILASHKGDIQELLNKALTKPECGKMPFIVFIDINAPFKNEENFQNIPWIKDIRRRAHQAEENTKDNPSPCNAVYFTNYSYHYQTDEEAAPGQVLQSLPLFQKHPIPDPAFYSALLNALHYYGDIPDIDVIE